MMAVESLYFQTLTEINVSVHPGIVDVNPVTVLFKLKLLSKNVRQIGIGICQLYLHLLRTGLGSLRQQMSCTYKSVLLVYILDSKVLHY